MPPRLPIELWTEVIQYLLQPRPLPITTEAWSNLHQYDLSVMMRVNSTFNAITAPILYSQPIVSDLPSFFHGIPDHRPNHRLPTFDSTFESNIDTSYIDATPYLLSNIASLIHDLTGSSIGTSSKRKTKVELLRYVKGLHLVYRSPTSEQPSGVRHPLFGRPDTYHPSRETRSRSSWDRKTAFPLLKAQTALADVIKSASTPLLPALRVLTIGVNGDRTAWRRVKLTAKDEGGIFTSAMQDARQCVLALCANSPPQHWCYRATNGPFAFPEAIKSVYGFDDETHGGMDWKKNMIGSGEGGDTASRTKVSTNGVTGVASLSRTSSEVLGKNNTYTNHAWSAKRTIYAVVFQAYRNRFIFDININSSKSDRVPGTIRGLVFPDGVDAKYNFESGPGVEMQLYGYSRIIIDDIEV